MLMNIHEYADVTPSDREIIYVKFSFKIICTGMICECKFRLGLVPNPK